MGIIGRFAVVGAVLVATGCGVAGAGGAPEVDLGSVAPCELVSPAQLAEVGLGGARATPADTGPLRGCAWVTPSEPGSFAPPVTLTVAPDTELDELRAGGVGGPFEDTDVGGYPSIRGTGQICAEFVDVGPGVVGVLGGRDCAATRRVAEFAVAGLPG